MALVTTTKMFEKAFEGKYAIGAFNINNMEIIQGVVSAAKKQNSAIILQVSKSALKYAHPLYLKKMVDAAIEETGLDISNVTLCGVKQWTQRDGEYRYIVFFYKTNTFSGEIKSSDEGRVFWIKKDQLKNYTLANDFDKMFEVFDNDNLSENYYWFEDNEWKVENK